MTEEHLAEVEKQFQLGVLRGEDYQGDKCGWTKYYRRNTRCSWSNKFKRSRKDQHDQDQDDQSYDQG